MDHFTSSSFRRERKGIFRFASARVFCASARNDGTANYEALGFNGLLFGSPGRLKTRIFAVNACTWPPFWLSVVLRTITTPWFGLELEGTISMMSLSTRSVSPGRVGLGHAISPPSSIL